MYQFLGNIQGDDCLKSFVSAMSVIVVSEIGDKTFFMSAIFAMKFSRSLVFLGSVSAASLMTLLSAFLGYVTTIFSKKIISLISAILFVVFGLKMFHEGYEMEPDEGMADFQKVKLELERKKLTEIDFHKSAETDSAGCKPKIIRKCQQLIHSFISPVFIQSFVLTFLAEWGDRSQFTTIVLAANKNLMGVLIGGITGQILCTGLAVTIGRFIAQRMSLKAVQYLGGVIFIASGFCSFILD